MKRKKKIEIILNEHESGLNKKQNARGNKRKWGERKHTYMELKKGS